MFEEKIYKSSIRPDDRLSIGGKQLCIIIALASLLSGILGMLSSFSIMIAQQVYTGFYLSHINYRGIGGINPIDTPKGMIEPHCQFILIRLENGKVALLADNGLYLSRINCSNIDARNSGEAANKITDSCTPFAFPFPAPSRLLWNGHNPGN
jgi:hypothetical protein